MQRWQLPLLQAQHHAKVTIEEDCWVGINVVVMRGITIAKGCVIGANSVVTKNTIPYTVWAGNPAKMLKKRLDFEPPQSIAYNQTTDLPYFYKGFLTDQASRSTYAQRANGMAALADFKVSVKPAAKIFVVAKSLVQGEIVLQHATQSIVLDTNYKTCAFDCETINNLQHFLIVNTNKNLLPLGEVLAIQKIWTA
jgi:hypothetical protein